MTPAEVKRLHKEPPAGAAAEHVVEAAAPEASEPLVVDALETNRTALASAETQTLTATQSALWNVSVGGDADVVSSVVGMVSSKGPSAVRQGVAGAVMTEGDATITQGGGGLIIAKRLDMDAGGGGALVAGEAELHKSYVGLLLARKASFAEDSRVLFDWKAALILAAVLVGGIGIIVLAVFLVGRAIVARIRHLTDRLPHLPQMPHVEIPGWMRTLAHMRRAA